MSRIGISVSSKLMSNGSTASTIDVIIGITAARTFSTNGRILLSSLLTTFITADKSSAISGSTAPSISNTGSTIIATASTS